MRPLRLGAEIAPARALQVSALADRFEALAVTSAFEVERYGPSPRGRGLERQAGVLPKTPPFPITAPLSSCLSVAPPILKRGVTNRKFIP
jgi:hypothetical protein